MNKDQERAWKKGERESSRERTKLLEDTRAEVIGLLNKARDDIALTLAGQPTEYQQWRLSELNKEIDRVLGDFGRSAGQALSTAAGNAWDGGIAAIDKPMAAAQIQAIMPHLDAGQLMGMRAFMVDRIQDVGTAAASKIKAELGLAMIGNQSVHDTITRVGNILGDGSRQRATTIVRTELSRAWAVASNERAAQSEAAGVNMDKVWRRSGKVHSRLAHDLADGRRVPLKDPFIINGHALQHPHDPKAPASETINCGCICLYRPRGTVSAIPDKRPFTEQEIALNPNKAELANGKGMADYKAAIGSAVVSRSVSEAEQFARSLGIAQTRYEGSLAAANIANEGLEMLKTRGLKLPDGVLVDPGVFKYFGYKPGEADAMFSPTKSGQTMILLDPASAHWADPEKVAAAQFADGWWSTDSRLHPILHEAGHLSHYLAGPKEYALLYRAGAIPVEALADISGLVSDYAMTTPVEFVAEVFAGLITGRVYPSSVMSWYKHFGGVKP